ncbi:hypothetical protein WDU94_006164 [Cyamophila willieti]
MSDQLPAMSKVKTELGLQVTTYTTRNDNEFVESVLTVIENEPLDIPYDKKVEPDNELLNSEQDTLIKQEVLELEDLITDDAINGNALEYNSNDEEPKVKSTNSIKRTTITSHSEEYNNDRYPCDQCTKSFASKRSLNRHRLVHEGIRFPCNKCLKTFSTRGHLTTHLRIHEGIRFPCDKCSQSFSRKTNLKRHLLTHSEPFDNKKTH